MSISFIQQRLSELDGYLRNLDIQKQEIFAREPSSTASRAVDFDKVLEKAITKSDSTDEVYKSVKAKKIDPDNYSKLPENFEQYIDSLTAEISDEFSVDLSPNLIKSVIKQESGFNPNATSHAGAQGLMQLMPATAKSLGVYNPMNPYQNLRGGVTYLAQMMQKFDGNIQKSLAAYNAGPAAIEKYGGVPPYRETQNYVASIMKDYLGREDYDPVDMIG